MGPRGAGRHWQKINFIHSYSRFLLASLDRLPISLCAFRAVRAHLVVGRAVRQETLNRGHLCSFVGSGRFPLAAPVVLLYYPGKSETGCERARRANAVLAAVEQGQGGNEYLVASSTAVITE